MDRLALPAVLESMGAFQEFVTGKLERAGAAPLVCTRVEMVLEELLTNIIYYAYPNGEGEIALDCGVKDGALRIRITDSGVPFNMLDKPDPDTTLSVDERAIGGLGIFLVREVMDEVRYERKNDTNVLHLTLSLQ
ncbi:MAG: ATP-binding protein [Desulfovibrionaceae bacterium]|jgi:serine/threonine-protein kinase RsbW|nr:ATP-binding protein [Desulfovibrionaceae bacterium]